MGDSRVRAWPVVDLSPEHAAGIEWGAPGVLAQLLEAAPTAIYATDASGQITFYNQAAVTLWGSEPEVGKSEWCGFRRLFRSDQTPMPPDECPMAMVLSQGQSIEGAEVVGERPDGARVAVLAYPAPLHSRQGRLIGAVNALVDITERKRNEALQDCHQQVLQMLASGVPLTQTLEFLIDAMERNCTPGILGSVLLLNEAGTHFQRGIGPSLPEGFNAAVEGVAVNSRIGLCCHAVLGGTTVSSSDFANDPKWASFAEFVAPYGLRAGWSAPIFGSDGRVLGTFANYYKFPCDPAPRDLEWVDIVRRSAAIAIERKAADMVAQRLASIVNSSEDAIGGVDKSGRITTWNQAAERLYGYKAEEIVGKPVTLLVPTDQLAEETNIMPRILRGEHVAHYETVRRRKDGSLVEISLSVSPVTDETGEVVGASGIARDITERRRAEQGQKLLLREMGHRVNNLFSVASGLVNLSARFAATPMDMARTLLEKLNALARAHGLTRQVAAEDQGDTLQGAKLHALVRTLLMPYEIEHSSSSRRVVIEGPDPLIGASAVTSIALVLHELATNAAKYGALSCPQGFVQIRVSETDNELRLAWEERDGPQVHAPATHQGFGSLLMHRVVVDQFNGKLARHWNSDGLSVHLSIPVDHLKN